MKRVFVKAGLSNLSTSKKITLGSAVSLGLTNNPLILNAAQIQQNVDTATQNLIAAEATAETGTDADEQALLVVENTFDAVMNTAILFVQGVADAATSSPQAKQIILSSGFGARKTPEPSPIPQAVAFIAALYTGVAGTIKVKWKNSKYARFYKLYHSTNPNDPNSWTLVFTDAKRETIQTDLEGFVQHYFKVVAVGTHGDSDPSDLANCICLPPQI